MKNSFSLQPHQIIVILSQPMLCTWQGSCIGLHSYNNNTRPTGYTSHTAWQSCRAMCEICICLIIRNGHEFFVEWRNFSEMSHSWPLRTSHYICTVHTKSFNPPYPCIPHLALASRQPNSIAFSTGCPLFRDNIVAAMKLSPTRGLC